MSGLGKCSIRGCDKEAGAVYPLLAGSPTFCSAHHNPRDAGPFGCDFTGPDDFDPPLWDEAPEFQEPILRRREFVWMDRYGDEHKLKDIDNRYLVNIINFLARAENEDYDRTVAFLMKEARRRVRERARQVMERGT